MILGYGGLATGTTYTALTNKQTGEWRACDGATVTLASDAHAFRALQQAFPTGKEWPWGMSPSGDYVLPKLEGMFLRGADPTAKLDVLPRTHDATLTAGFAPDVRGVGTYQKFATARPQDPQGFRVPTASLKHTHLVGDIRHQPEAINQIASASLDVVLHTNASRNIATEEGQPTTDPAVAGGDQETVPRNASVIWLIRVR